MTGRMLHMNNALMFLKPIRTECLRSIAASGAEKHWFIGSGISISSLTCPRAGSLGGFQLKLDSKVAMAPVQSVENTQKPWSRSSWDARKKVSKNLRSEKG